MNYKKVVVVFAFLFAVGHALAQVSDFEIDTRASGPVMICGDAITFTVTIRNTTSDNIENIRLLPQMPVGMRYVTGSASGMSEVTPVSATNPSFIVSDMTGGQQKTVSFMAKGDCELIATLRSSGSGSNLIHNETKITYRLGGVEKEILEPNGSESYSVLFPQIEVFVPESEKNLGAPFINKVLNRHITIRNSGLGRLNALDFYLKTDQELALDKVELVTGSGSQTLTYTILSPTLGRKYTITDFSGTGDGDAYFEENEEVHLTDYVKATTSKGSIETIYTVQWGCLSIICNPGDQNASFAAYVEAIGGEPTTSVNTQVISGTDFCNDAAVIKWSFSNTGSGNSPASRDAAFNIQLMIYQSGPLTMDNHHFFINRTDGSLRNIDDVYTFEEYQQNSPNLPTYYVRRYIFNLRDKFATDPDGAGGLEDVDNDGFFDDLLPANTVSFTSQTLAVLGGVNEYIFNYYVNANVTYEKWSGTLLSQSNYYQPVSLRALSQRLVGPSDLVNNGKRESIRFELKEYNGSSLIKEGNDAIFRINLTLPQGVTIRSAKWNNKVLTYTQTGNTVTIVDPLLYYPTYYNLDFEYDFDCANVVPGTLVEKMSLEMLYYFDKNCSQYIKLAGAEKEMYVHCDACSTVETSKFAVERKTLGWKLPPFFFHRYGDLFGANPKVEKVARNPETLKLDAAYPKDEIEVLMQGRTAINTSLLSAEIKYTAPMQHEMFHFVSAEFMVNGTVYALPAGYQPVKVVQDSTYTFTFAIPLPVQLTANTVFEFKAKYTVDRLDDVTRGEYPIFDFRGRFFTRINNVPTGCLGFGDDFLIYKPTGRQASTGFTLTDKGKMGISHFRFEGGNDNIYYGIQDFPNEFRPIFYNDVQTITLPKGYVFDRTQPVEFSIGTPGSGNTFSLSGATFSADNRTLTIPRNNDTPLINYIEVYFVATVKVDCENPDNLFVPVNTFYDLREPLLNTFSLRSFAYLPLTSSHEPSPLTGSNGGGIYNYRRPNLQLTANSIQEGYSEVVSWPVQICNPNSTYRTNSPYTWVSFELKADDQSTIIRQVLDEHDNPLEFVRYGPVDADHPEGRHVMVKLGTIELTSCVTLKVMAGYKNCEEDKLQDVNVLASWDYLDYPSVANYAGSIVDRKTSCEGFLLSETMTIKYKTADLQWEVRKNGPEEVDLCVATPFEIDLASTKYGDLRDLKVWLQLPDHATLDPSATPQFHYPYNAPATDIPADAVLSQDGRIGWDVAKIIGGNLPGIRVSTNKMKLSFQLTTSCGFDPGLPIKYTVTGYTNCGDYVELLDQRKIRLQGVTLDTLELSLTTPQALTCFSEDVIALTIKNNGFQPSRFSQLELMLPFGTEYREMVMSDLPSPAVSIVNNQTRLLWTLPAGYLASGESKSISVKTYLSQTAPGSNGVRFVARTYKTADAHCAQSTEPCSIQATSSLAEVTVPVTGLASLDIRYRKYICAYKFNSVIDQTGNCALATFSWNFGDGGTSLDREPFHAFERPGTYNVSLIVNFDCGGCSGTQSRQIQVVIGPNETIFKDTIIDVLTDIRKQVIQVSAATFADAWPTQHIDDDLIGKPGFLNGSQGVWRNEAEFIYKTTRRASDTVNLAKDGTFTLDHFNWEQAELNAIPGWIKANTMTQYSPYSYDLENRDVLGIYSSALYDYGGHLPSANGANMRNSEMAFTSFEYIDGKSSGNWIFGNEALPTYYLYNVRTASGNGAVVEASLKELEDVEKVDVIAKGLVRRGFFYRLRYNFLKDNEIVCMQPYPQHPEWSIIVLKHAPFKSLWRGRIKVNNEIVPIISPDIDQQVAHSGTRSLTVSTVPKEFKQNLLQLDSGKRYVVNAWVTAKNPNVLTPRLADSLGFDVVIRNKNEQIISTYRCRPSGPVVEGWQQVKGTFTYTGGRGATLELKFYPGSTGQAWYDDLRLHPEKGNMKSYVYDLKDYRLRAVLDEENFASFYFYDAEGNLYLMKKETEGGIKTLSENVNSMVDPGTKR
jgi:uncharacterized repeat protein (TIGR01451 family)